MTIMKDFGNFDIMTEQKKKVFMKMIMKLDFGRSRHL